MNLKDLVSKLEENKIFPTSSLYGENYLTSEHLKIFRERLLECDEFKDVTELGSMGLPIVCDKNGKVLTAVTIKMSDVTKLKGRVYLFSLFLAPEPFNPETAYTPVKDGCAISPVMFDPKDFSPSHRIILTFNPSELEDSHEKVKKHLHAQLDNLLNHRSEYQIKGERAIMLRGLFEGIEGPNGLKTYEVGEIDSESSYVSPKYYSVFYFKTKSEQPSSDNKDVTEITLELASKIIPASLKESYLEFKNSLSNNGIPMEEQMRIWCSKNNISLE